jgi:AraC-like DNA-binding protein
VAIWALLLVQAVVYISRVIRRLRRYRRDLREEVSSLKWVDQSWLLWFSRALHFLYLGYAGVPFVLLHAGGAPAARHLIGLLLCLVVGILAGHQLIGGRSQAVAMPAKIPAQATPASWDPDLPAALRTAMAERALFRDPALTLGSLSQSLGWPRNEVSAAINGYFRQSFHDFINGYRVEEAKRLMLDPAKGSYTLVALALDAGFNSKPTFNTVFKKTTGQTPSAWLKEQKKV